MSATQISTDLLPDSFPRAPKECKRASDDFFGCFNTNAVKSASGDADAGVRGLQKCLGQLKSYKKCMESFEAKNPPKRFRVSECISLRVNVHIENDLKLTDETIILRNFI